MTLESMPIHTNSTQRDLFRGIISQLNQTLVPLALVLEDGKVPLNSISTTYLSCRLASVQVPLHSLSLKSKYFRSYDDFRFASCGRLSVHLMCDVSCRFWHIKVCWEWCHHRTRLRDYRRRNKVSRISIPSSNEFKQIRFDSHPKPFKCSITPRSEKAMLLIQDIDHWRMDEVKDCTSCESSESFVLNYDW